MREKVPANLPHEHSVRRISFSEFKNRIDNGQPLTPDEPNTEYTASFDIPGWVHEHKVATIAITGTATAIGAATFAILISRHNRSRR